MSDKLNSQELDNLDRIILQYLLFPNASQIEQVSRFKDLVNRREQEAAQKVITRATEMIEREIHHAKDNGQYLKNVQGLGPGEKVIAVRIDYLEAVLSSLNKLEEQK